MNDLLIIGTGDDPGTVNLSATSNTGARLTFLQSAYPRKLEILHIEPDAGHLVPILLDQFEVFKHLNNWLDFGLHDSVTTIRAAIEYHRLKARASELESKLSVLREIRAQG